MYFTKMNTHGIFITGTGTDVGKTFVASFALTLLKSLGHKALYYKPIQCGPAIYEGDEYPGGDPEVIRDVLGHPDVTSTWLLSSPTSPHLAFPKDSRIYNPKPVHELLVSSRKHFEFIVMEGAGGIRVPISDGYEMTDLAKASSFPVLVVAQPGLGTINHTLLTLEHLQAHHLPIAGFVFSETRPDMISIDPMAGDNANVIQTRSGIQFLGNIPRWEESWPADAVKKHPLLDYFVRSVR